MTTFFVGQRVRIIRRRVNQELVGKEAIIISGLFEAVSTLGDIALVHDIRVPGFGEFGSSGHRLSSRPSDIEPILPSGHTAGHEGVCEELDKLLAGEIA